MSIQIDRTEETKIVLTGEWNSAPATRLSEAWFNAMALDHKLPDAIRYMHGMSGKKYRYLINNLVEHTPDARYLEIGCWAGSTACAALWANTLQATCIDNWSEFGGPKQAFMQNIQFCLDHQPSMAVAQNSHVGNPDPKNNNDITRLSNDKINFKFIENDFKLIDYSSLGKHNIYMFDGPHSTQDQYDGIALVQSALDDVYTLIVDDWNAPSIREGTLSAMEKVGNKIVASIEVLSSTDGSHPKICQEMSDWHNGYIIAVVSKK